MRRRKRDSIPSKYILSAIAAVCVGFMLLSYVFGFQGGPLGTISGYLFVPIQKGINYVGWYLSDRADNLQDLRLVMAERDALQEQVDQLTIENSQLMQEKYELEDLRALYDLDRSYSDYSKVAANVIGKDSGKGLDRHGDGDLVVGELTENGISVGCGLADLGRQEIVAGN